MNRFARVLAPALFAITAFTQTLPSGVQKKASMGGITEYDFPNGLKVLLYPDAANPEVTINVTYLVGSRHEGYGETGMAHLLEHLDFIETTNGRQIKNEITAHATNWNGTTSYDRTNYYETIPATDDNLKWALGLEADRMVNVKFTQQILDTEMTVVRNEFERGENSPRAYLAASASKPRLICGTTTANRPSARKTIWSTCRWRGRRLFITNITGPIMRCWCSPGGWTKRRRCNSSPTRSARFRVRAEPVEQTYTIEPPQDGERFVELRRSRPGAGSDPRLSRTGGCASGFGGLAGAGRAS